MTLVTDALMELVKMEAEARHQSHKNHKSSRPLSKDYELIGLLGELEFAKATGVMPDLERKLDGDKGIDFVVPVRLSVDVKTARKAFNLIHEQGKPFADIYVLAQYEDDQNRTKLLGWEFGSTLSRAPVKDFGYGIINHYIPAENLRPMSALLGRIK